jgi:competence protein ComEA
MLNGKFLTALQLVILVGLLGAIPVTADEVEKIDINTATAEELMQLHGVGSKYAARIIRYREKFGPFKTPEDIMQVSGIGPKTFEKNKEIIIVAEPQKKLD